MRMQSLLIGLTFLCLPASAAEPPATITRARVEVRTGVSPVAALDQAARAKVATWVGWSVPALPGLGDVCCFTDNFKRRGCSLAERVTSWGTTDSGTLREAADLYVLVESKEGASTRLRVVSSTCAVDGADRRLVWLGAVEPAASLSALDRLVDGGKDIDDQALAAIAYHADPRADAIIERRALDRSISRNAREQAVFWAGHARGDAGFKLLDRILASDPDDDLRQHAVFALSQSDVARAPERIKRVATDDRDPEVRAHAYFSLSQTKAAGVGEWIVSRLDVEKDEEVRDQAVFALSQLEDGTDWLLKVLRSKRDPETTRKALFWLGQSDDPRALDEISRILER